MKPIYILIFFGIFSSMSGQTQVQEIQRVLQDFFEAIHLADTNLMATTLHPDARLQTIVNPERISRPMSRQDLLLGMSRLSPKAQTEKLWRRDIRIDGALAHAWLPYSFYVGDTHSHCGHNSVTLCQTTGGWQILHIVDTRHAECAEFTTASQLDSLLDAWHDAAARADEDLFFGAMTPDAIYLGTDASEKWTSGQLQEWSKKYFDRESAWNFKATSREIYFSQDGTVAWFDELLDTWMGDCRGSGVLELQTDGLWKLKQYNLAILVPNDRVQDYLKMMDPESEKQ